MKVNFYLSDIRPVSLRVKALFFVLSISISTSLLAKDNINNANLNTGNNLRSSSTAHISDFTVVPANGEYQLSWQTVTEDNVRQYEVEYSYNNKDYQRAGIVSAANRANYSYNHITLAKTSMFYRLKIVGFDGSAVYSKVVNVDNSLARPDDIVSPTVIRDGVLNISLGNSYRNLQVFNSAGREVFREYLGGRSGNRIGFTLPGLPAGPYFVKLIGNGISTTKRVVVM